MRTESRQNKRSFWKPCFPLKQVLLLQYLGQEKYFCLNVSQYFVYITSLVQFVENLQLIPEVLFYLLIYFSHERDFYLPWRVEKVQKQYV